ncbi:MAG: tetratricopeptide repeat protein [Candidatus Omnitrophica bacterium]|nr:tetratricopeptide repeat protein [Candidatus Omnitrophota bacterium]
MRNFKLILFLIFLFVFTSVNGFAQITEKEALSRFVSAGMAYKDGQYEEAITKYTQIIEGGLQSGAVYYNLGNSYFKKGDMGRAILNYERAKSLIPRDSDLNFNNRYVSSRINRYSAGEKINFLDRTMKSYIEFYTINEMVMILVGAIFVLGMVFLLSLYLNWPRSFIQGMAAFLSLIVMIYAVGLVVKIQYARDLAVVVTAAESYFEPRDDSTVHFKLSEGMKAKIMRPESNWIKIERLDGKRGWVPLGVLERI